MNKFITIISLITLPFLSSYAEETGDIFLDSDTPSAYTLSKGVLQVGSYFSYINLSLANAIGADIDSNAANGVGEFSEKGGQIWFGLTDRLTAGFKFSMADFEYKNKKANVSFQELRVRRALLTDHPLWGYVSLEGGWRRHSTNEVSFNGISQDNLSNVLHDYGWSTRLQITKTLLGIDFHSRLGYNKYDEDGDGGQNVIEIAFGLTKFFAQKYQFDFFVQQYRIKRNSPTFSTSLTDENNIVSLGIKRHFANQWALEMKGQMNDNLFRGYWAFMDREVGNVNFSRYGYFTIGASYRFNYSK